MVAALLLLALQTASAQPDRFGLPACEGPSHRLVIRTAFTLCLSDAHKTPLWAAYELTRDMLHASAPRQSFRPDPALAATNADYRNSGYHRSHLVPAVDVAANPEALRETYLLSNAVPQLPELNLSAWRRIENDIRKLAARSDAVYVLTGALFDCADLAHIGPNQVAVPCAMYKVVLAVQGDNRTAYGAMLTNQPGATRQTASVREIEQRAALDFFPALTAVESTLETTAVALR